MFDNINGARLAAKRVQEAFSLKASLAREIVARAGSWRDWHHLEHTLGDDRRGTVSIEALTRYLSAKNVHLNPAAVVASIAPQQAAAIGGIAEVMAAAGSPGFIRRALKGTLQSCQRDAEHDGITAAVTVRDGIETTWFHANPSNAYGLREEDDDDDYDPENPGPHDGPPGELRYGFDDVSVRDIQWIVRDDGGTAIAAAFASHLAGDCVWAEVLPEIDGSPMADAELLMPLLDGAYEPLDLQFLTVNAIEVDASVRGQGVGTRLMRRMLEDVRTLCGNEDPIEVLVDATARRQVDAKPQQIAFAQWLDRPAITGMVEELMGTKGPETYISGRLHVSTRTKGVEGLDRRVRKAASAGGPRGGGRGPVTAYGPGEINWIQGRSDQFVEHLFEEAATAVAELDGVPDVRKLDMIRTMERTPLQFYSGIRNPTWVNLHMMVDEWTSPPSAMPVGGNGEFSSDHVILASTLDLMPMAFGLSLVPRKGALRTAQHPRGHWIWSQLSHPLAIRDITLNHADMDDRIKALDERMCSNLLTVRPISLSMQDLSAQHLEIRLGQGLPGVAPLPPGDRAEAPVPAMPGSGRVPTRVRFGSLKVSAALAGRRLADVIDLPDCGMPHVDAAVAALMIEKVDGDMLHLAPCHHVGLAPCPDEAVRAAVEAMAGLR